MNYLSVCSGIEAATTAWHGLGLKPAAFSEIEPFPSAVLAHHYPDVPNLGDMTKYKEWNLENIDLLVGGTPCQSFSVAGLRAGLADPRGNLALVYCGIAERFSPRWLAWENVPGVLSSSKGEDFRSFLSALVGWDVPMPKKWGNSGITTNAPGSYGVAWRVLDAQYIRVQPHRRAVPQRRRRVFVVGYLGDWRRAAAVLFERESLRGNPPPSRKAGAGVAGTTARSLAIRGRDGVPQIEMGDEVANAILTPNGGRGGIGVGAVCMSTGQASAEIGIGIGTTLNCNHEAPIVTTGDGCLTAWDSQQKRVYDASAGVAPTLSGSDGGDGRYPPAYFAGTAVRRLTPKECERLQGFPDDYTLIPVKGKPAADGPRYKALGNSMAVNVMRWIGLRILAVERLT